MNAEEPPRAARAALDRALARMTADGRKPRCGEPGNHAVWLSDDPRLRALAATWCAGCLVLAECGAAALESQVTFGVWAGADLTAPDREGMPCRL